MCRNIVGWFIWTTTRDFPLDKLYKERKVMAKSERNQIRYNGYPVCMKCFNKLKKD
jgi:hypothetical protein